MRDIDDSHAAYAFMQLDGRYPNWPKVHQRSTLYSHRGGLWSWSGSSSSCCGSCEACTAPLLPLLLEYLCLDVGGQRCQELWVDAVHRIILCDGSQNADGILLLNPTLSNLHKHIHKVVGNYNLLVTLVAAPSYLQQVQQTHQAPPHLQGQP